MRFPAFAVLVAACSFQKGSASVAEDAHPDVRVADALTPDANRTDARKLDAPTVSPSAVQNAVMARDNATSASVTFGGAVTAGDLLVCFCRAGTTYTNITVSDNVNGAWTLVGGNGTSAMFYRANTAAAAAGTLTITATNTADPASSARLSADELTGVTSSAVLDKSVATSQSGATWTSAAITAPAKELVYVGVVQGDSVTFTAGTVNGIAMTIGGQSNAAGSIATEYALSSSAGSQAATITMTPSPAQQTLGMQATFVP